MDRFGRAHRDLRISLTDRCSLRCTYCMPEQGNEWLARSGLMTADEIVRVAGIAAASGITTFRLTGGEPHAVLREQCLGAARSRLHPFWKSGCAHETASTFTKVLRVLPTCSRE